VVGILVVRDSQQFDAPGSVRVGASWSFCVRVFMMETGRVCCTFCCFQRVTGCRVIVYIVCVYHCRGGVEGTVVGREGVGEGHRKYAGFELSKVDTWWWWSEGYQRVCVGCWVQWCDVRRSRK